MCSICCEEFSSTRRKKVTCPHCEFDCCRNCIEKYLLTDSNIYAKCMNCSHDLSDDFLINNTTKVFWNSKFLEKRALDSLSREKSLLPATQVYVKREKERRSIIEDIKQKDQEYIELQRLANAAYLEKRTLEAVLHNHYEDITNIEYVEKKKFTLPCPIKDCNGFLSNNYKCGTCDVKVCPHCREPKEYTEKQIVEMNIEVTEHVCDESLVETVKLIKSDTKPCPSCSAPIYKIEGCDQMYCTSCNTPFSWKTGKKVSGRIHNPHYYEYLRNRAGSDEIRREPGDDPCAQQVEITNVRYIYKEFVRICSLNSSTASFHLPLYTIFEAFRMPLHIREVLLENYQVIEDLELSKDAINNRVKYLLNELEEDKWISIIKQRIKKSSFSKAINDLLTMIADTVQTVFQNTFDKYQNVYYEINSWNTVMKNKFLNNLYKEIPLFLKELENIKIYANEEFRKIHVKYKLRTFVITELWDIKPCNTNNIPRICKCDIDPHIRGNRSQRTRFAYCKC